MAKSAERIGAGPLMINARAETVTSKPMFARLLVRRRCIVPVDGFYEWQRLQGGKKKQPFFLHPAEGVVFAFAGLWDVWSGPEGEPVPNLTILTTAANETVAQVHHRMPVILPGENWDPWLDPGLRDVEALRSMLIPAAPGVVVLHRVSDAVNNVRNNSAGLVVPIAAVPENTLLRNSKSRFSGSPPTSIEGFHSGTHVRYSGCVERRYELDGLGPASSPANVASTSTPSSAAPGEGSASSSGA